MGKIGGTGMLVVGVVLAFLGIILIAGLLDWLLDVTGIILLGLGLILGVIGVVQMMSGRGSSMDY